MVKLSAFADEISMDLDEQIETLRQSNVGAIELRRVWGKGVLDLTDEEAQTVARRARDNGIGFSAVGSPIGKFPLDGDFNEELARMRRALEIADVLGCRYVRMFSYHIPKGDDPAKHREQCMDWVGQLARLCEPTGVKCALENEKGIYTDTGERHLDMLATIDSPALVGIFDPANFVQCGERPYEDCWGKLKSRIEYFHIKDVDREKNQVVPAGEGDGDLPRILKEAFETGYDNFLTLEPHLKKAAASYGDTGPALFGVAVAALRKVLADIGVS